MLSLCPSLNENYPPPQAELVAEAGYRSLDQLVDRRLIEDEALDLLNSRWGIELDYKTVATYQDDARTLLMEALTASGHLSEIRLNGTLEEIHGTMLSVLLNAFNEQLPDFEQARRFEELCTELARQKIELLVADGSLSADTKVMEIADFPDSVPEAASRSMGYRALNKKGMLRSSQLEVSGDGSFRRVLQQVSRSQADAELTKQFLLDHNLSLLPRVAADVAVLGSAFVDDSAAGVVGLMRRLDNFQAPNIRYGQKLQEDQIPYHQLAEESRRREQQIEVYVDQLGSFTQRLDARLTSGELHQAQYDRLLKIEIRGILQAICVLRPEYAADCFGKQVAASYYAASNAAATGDVVGSARVVVNNQHRETPPLSCGMIISEQEDLKLDSLSQLIRLGLEAWLWGWGVCRVEACPSRPAKTEVGACSVCRGCQAHFDHGRNPAQVYRTAAWLAKKVRPTKSRPAPALKLLDFSGYKKPSKPITKPLKPTRHETMAA